MMNQFVPERFFDWTGHEAEDLFSSVTYVWEAIPLLPPYIENRIRPQISGEIEEGAWIEPGCVQLGEGSRVERGAIVRGPTIIGRDTVIRTGAYIRGHVMVGDGCLIGHGTEIRQTLILNQSHIPHLNCFFTSLVGNRVHIGGNVHTANLRGDKKEVMIRIEVNGKRTTVSTGQNLFGAVIGDDSNVGGCSLLQPGCVIGRRCIIYPMSPVSGYIPPDSMLRPRSTPVEVISRRGR